VSVTGRYHFLSWSRRGIGASAANKDAGGVLPARPNLAVNVTLSVDNAVSAIQPKPVPVETFGPGDVIGIDPRHIIRTEPRPFTPNFEPNYLCGIEFDMPDFPWLFTPAAANGDRLRPWVALIVLKQDEFRPSPLAPNPLFAIEVQKISVLHNLAFSWNWAHTQISGDTPLADALTSAPGAVISRLVCPRRLDPETRYTAFLVPAFEIGRQAGLGQDVSGSANTDAAWNDHTPAPLTLPVYYQFEFTTSDEGDFESLVRRLTPRVLDKGVGQRDMDVSQPLHNIPSAGPPLGLRGALQSITTQDTPWNDPDRTNFQTKVQDFINQPSFADDDPANPRPDDPVIAPPIYGRWHAAVQSVDRTQPGWVNELNLDPRNRSAGGMGTQVVQNERTSLMASAWQQFEGVIKANQLLKQAQLARAAMQQLFRQHFVRAQAATVVAITAPLHARILASPVTIRALTRASRVPERMLSATFRRVTRPRRRVGTGVARRTPLLERVNSNEVPFVPPAKPPDGMVSIDQVTDTLPTPPPPLPSNRLLLFALVLLVLVILIALAGGIVLGVVAAAIAVVVFLIVRANTPPPPPPPPDPAQNLRGSKFTPEVIAAIPPRTAFQITPPGVLLTGTAAGPESAAGKAFRDATTDLFTYAQAQPVDPPLAPALELASVKTTLMARLDPITTVPRRALSLISLTSRVKWQPVDPIEPIMAAPEFPQPMYAPLRDLSPDYVLPGVELVPPDTMGIVLANHQFIEGYLAGLNHEMARQLLFNGYLTDQRGSYFRQFWDVSAYVRQAGDPTDPAALAELLKDIPLEHTWDKSLALGEHPNRTDVPLNNVVLLVRGELFKRYPNCIVFAGKAKRNPDGTRGLDDTDERYPIFRGTLPPDITFLGFNLSLDDARGGTPTAPEGFFFVFQEQPSEPRFGLEPTEAGNPTTDWADLAWTNFGGGGGDGGIFQLPDLGRTTRAQTIKFSPWRLASQVFGLVVGGTSVPDFLSPILAPSRIAINGADNPDDPHNNWGVNSAQTAYILLRAPFRILKHADLMLTK
jgi:hypothetical protein